MYTCRTPTTAAVFDNRRRCVCACACVWQDTKNALRTAHSDLHGDHEGAPAGQGLYAHAREQSCVPHAHTRLSGAGFAPYRFPTPCTQCCSTCVYSFDGCGASAACVLVSVCFSQADVSSASRQALVRLARIALPGVSEDPACAATPRAYLPRARLWSQRESTASTSLIAKGSHEAPSRHGACGTRARCELQNRTMTACSDASTPTPRGLWPTSFSECGLTKPYCKCVVRSCCPGAAFYLVAAHPLHAATLLPGTEHVCVWRGGACARACNTCFLLRCVGLAGAVRSVTLLSAVPC